MPSNSFRELLDRAWAGDAAAATELIREFEPQIRRVVRFRLTDSAMRRDFDSMDVCQSVMADFFVGARNGKFQLETPEQLIGLLAKMARNNLLNRVEHRRAAKRDVRRTNGGDIAEIDVAGGDTTPSQVISEQELLELARKRLSAEDLQLAEGRAAGKSWDELAKEVGGSADCVRVRLQRALAKVRQQLGIQP
jgi:RNA polymerase sigma factor (sigma-70 family)